MARRRPSMNPGLSARSLREPEPTVGANRREGLLLVGYALLFVIGVWTVAVAELSSDDPAALRSAPASAKVSEPTQSGVAPAP